MKYLTDAERQLRPERIRAEYCFWIAFWLNDRLMYQRWFQSAELRDHYGSELPANATIIGIGDES